ncbi:MAG: chemotaxis protein CheW [Thermotaleaceae bacterium]
MMETRYVLFHIGEQEYCVDIDYVEGINKIKDFKILKVPNTQGFVEGIINLRGSVIPLYNLRKKFQFEDTHFSKDSEILIVTTKGMKVGFIVDIVLDIIKLNDKDIDLSTNLFTQVSSEFIYGIGKADDRMLIILDVAHILSKEEREQIAPISQKESSTEQNSFTA